jgi:hypothetical protein
VESIGWATADAQNGLTLHEQQTETQVRDLARNAATLTGGN